MSLSNLHPAGQQARSSVHRTIGPLYIATPGFAWSPLSAAAACLIASISIRKGFHFISFCNSISNQFPLPFLLGNLSADHSVGRHVWYNVFERTGAVVRLFRLSFDCVGNWEVVGLTRVLTRAPCSLCYTFVPSFVRVFCLFEQTFKINLVLIWTESRERGRGA